MSKQLYSDVAFLTSQDAYVAMEQDLRAARSLSLTSLQLDPPETGTGAKYKLAYFQAVDTLIADRSVGSKPVRRLTVVSPGRLVGIRASVARSLSSNHYQLRELILASGTTIWNLQIFEGSALYLMDPEVSQDNANTYIRHVRIAYHQRWADVFTHFQRLYDSYWEGRVPGVGTEPLKTGAGITRRLDELAEVEPFRDTRSDARRPVLLRLEDVDTPEGFESCTTVPDVGAAVETLLTKIRRHEYRDLIPYPASDLKERVSRGSTALLFDPSGEELLSHISLKPLLNPEIARGLASLACLDGAFEVFEMATGWTHPSVRGRGFSSRLRRNLLRSMRSPNRVFVGFCRGLGASPVLQRLRWKCIPWDQFPYVSSLIGWRESGAFYKTGIGLLSRCQEPFNQESRTFEMTRKTDPDYLADWQGRVHFWCNSEHDSRRIDDHLRSVVSLYANSPELPNELGNCASAIELWRAMIKVGIPERPELAAAAYAAPDKQALR
ncbi:MAG: hypothetical protein AAGA68_11950 [Pseudomonadota bacterium]